MEPSWNERTWQETSSDTVLSEEQEYSSGATDRWSLNEAESDAGFFVKLKRGEFLV